MLVSLLPYCNVKYEISPQTQSGTKFRMWEPFEICFDVIWKLSRPILRQAFAVRVTNKQAILPGAGQQQASCCRRHCPSLPPSPLPPPPIACLPPLPPPILSPLCLPDCPQHNMALRVCARAWLCSGDRVIEGGGINSYEDCVLVLNSTRNI